LTDLLEYLRVVSFIDKVFIYQSNSIYIQNQFH
jgi:hypothetical protein